MVWEDGEVLTLTSYPMRPSLERKSPQRVSRAEASVSPCAYFISSIWRARLMAQLSRR